MNTLEGNKLIALFKEGDRTDDVVWLNTRPDEYFGNVVAYHRDWNLIMPVVEKIEGLGYRFKQCRRRVEIQEDSPEGTNITIQKQETKILSAWYAITQFIQWLNNEKAKYY